MASVLFHPIVALQAETGELVRGADGQIFAESDVNFESPLQAYDALGTPISVVSVGPTGLTQAFRVDTFDRVIWKSGPYVLPIWSPTGLLAVAREAAASGDEAAASAAQSAAAAASGAGTEALAALTGRVTTLETQGASGGSTSAGPPKGAIYVATTSAAFGVIASRTAVEAAISSCPEGGTVWFDQVIDGRYEWSGDIVVTKRVTLSGPGKISGSFAFGNGSARNELGARLVGLNFRRELDKSVTGQTVKGYADASYFVKLDRVRDVEITGCHFYGAAWPVYVAPNAAGASHDLSSINVHHNFFSECDWAFYAAFDVTSPGAWQCLADSNFESNIVNRSYVGMFYAQGVDGVHISGNTGFLLNYGSNTNPRWQEKRQNIYIGQSDWVHINFNALFEAGHESVFLDRARRVEMVGNQFAWPGQRVPSDAVVIKSNSGGSYPAGEYATLSFASNDGTYYSKSLLRLEGDFSGLALGPNTALFKGDADRFIGTSGQFTGTSVQIQAARRAALDAIVHWRYDLTAVTGLTASQITITDAALTKADHSDRLPGHTFTTSVQSLGASSVVGGAVVTPAAFVAATAQNVANVRGAGEAFSSFSGEVVVTVRTASNKEAVYKLLLAKTSAGTLDVLVMGALGYTAGATADDPSFAWSLSAGALTATPVGATVGVFTFSFTFSGNLIVG